MPIIICTKADLIDNVPHFDHVIKQLDTLQKWNLMYM